MAKKKQRINLIDRDGNSQVVEVNSTVADNKSDKKKSIGSTIKNTVSGIVKGGDAKAISKDYGALSSVARTVTGGVTSAKDKQGHNLIDNTKQVGKNLASGTFSGLTSIPDSALYEVRNSLEKGEKKAEEATSFKDALKSIYNSGRMDALSSNPLIAPFIKDDDDNRGGVEGALKSIKDTTDRLTGTKNVYKALEAFGEAYTAYKKSKGQESKLSKEMEKLQEKIDKPAEKYAQNVQEENQNYSKPVQVLGENFQTVGNMVPSIAASVLTKSPSAGMAALYQGAKGSATKEALQKGADLDTATAIGNAKGLIEVGTEQLSSGIKFKGKSVYGKGALDDVIENNVNRWVKNKGANWLVKQFGTAPLGEIAEETISDLAGNFIDKNTVDPNAKYTAKDWLHTAGMTYLSTLTLNLLGGSFGKASYNQNLQSMAETQVADIQNRVDRGLMSQEDGARAIEKITQELNDSIGTNEEISTPEEIQEMLANTSPEEIQQAVASATNAVANQVQQGKLNEQQGQRLLETIQENAQVLLEQQQQLTQNQNGQMQFNLDNQSTLEDKISLVQSLNDTEYAALSEITQKLKRGEQLNEQDRATLNYLNSKGTPQTVENTPISNETTQPSAIPQETQNVAQNEQNEGTQESTFNNKNEEAKKAEETFRNIKTKEDMDNLISNLKDKVDNIKTGEDLKNTFKEIYDIYKVYNKSNDIYEVVEKDGLYGTKFESEFYNPDIKYKPLNEEIKIQKDNLESWLRTIKDNSEEIIYNNQDKVTPTIGKNIDSLDKVTPITTDDFKNKLHDYIDKQTEDIKGKFESKDGHLFRGGREVRYLYRAIDQAEMDSIKNNGYIKSNQSKNIGYEIEQGLTDFKDNYPGFYLPRNADGYIIKIEVKPENGFFYDSDEYAKTPNEIPANQIVEINGEKINTQQETKQNENKEKPRNIGVHYGDLGKARDTYYWNINSSNRSTGHYGTGTYFVSNEESDRMQNSSFTRSDRPRKEVDFDDYNLYKPLIESEAKRLHDGLKAVNYNKYDDFDYRVMEDDLKRNGITQEQIDNAKNAVEEARQKYEKEGYNDKYDAEVDSLSTVFMKNLGFDGIDVRGLEGYDNTSYGSVIYDLKNNQDNTSNKDAKDKNGTSDSSFSNENALANRDNNAIDKQGNPVMAPFLQNNGGNGGNGGDNNNTTALGKQPEPKKGSVEADILRSYDERIANKKKPFKEKIDTVMHETTRALFDKGEEIYRIGKGHNDAELYPLYDLAQTSKASADFSINADQTNLKGEKVGESLNKVWEEVEKKNLVYEMNKYLYEQHNLDRWNQLNEDGSRKYVFGPEHSDIVSKKNIADLLRLHPELEELSKPILQYQKNLKQLLVDSGLQSQSQSDKLDSIYKNYVPTWRDKDNTGIKAMSNYGGNVTVNNQIKTAKGSSENLLPLKEVQAQMTENIFKAARMNVFLQQLYKDIGDINELKKIGMNSLKSDTNIEPIDADAFYKAAEEHLDEYLKNYAPNNAKVDKVNGQPVATVWFNGHKVTMPIDKGIQTALEPVTVDGSVAKILETINNFKRGVITEYNPIFAITNAKKDIDDAIINSKFSAAEYQAEYAKSIKEMLSNKKMSKEEQTLFNQYLAMGGYSNTVFDKRTGFAKEPKAGGKVLAKIGDMNDFIEQIPRFTEFKLTLKHGGSLTEAMYNAAEVTTNFKRSGVLTKKMDKLATTFFSASMAGFYKQVRNLTQQPSGRAYARFAAKSLAIGLTPAIINGLMYANPFGDDDDKDEAAEAYKNLPQYVKDDYLVWYIGDGKFMRIPKGRVASIPGIVYNAAKNKVQNEEVSFGEMVNSVLNQVGPSNPLSSNAILQIWQSGLFDNKSQGTSWNGSKIESSYLHKKEVTERYDSKTDEISKAISKGVSKATGGKIKISPKKLNYTIDQNSGIIGDILLPIFTPKSTGPSTVARIFNPITSKFTTDTVVSNKTSNKFYDKIDKYNEKVDAETATRADLVKKSYLSSANGEIADKRKQIEEIESSDLSKNEKYKQTRELQKEINNLQKKALEDENTYKKVGKEVSTIGDEVYYKSSYDGRTTWKKESDKTKAKRDELGLSVEKYYYYKKDEAFKKPDGKTTSIVDGKTAKDKIALVDAFGFDPSDYEKYSYEINQIKAGKDTQRQVTEYIESLPISATQKAALYKKKYKSYRNADRTIYNSIENSNLSKEEKESLAKFLKIK